MCTLFLNTRVTADGLVQDEHVYVFLLLTEESCQSRTRSVMQDVSFIDMYICCCCCCCCCRVFIFLIFLYIFFTVLDANENIKFTNLARISQVLISLCEVDVILSE